MMNLESFRSYRKIDLLVIVALAFIWALITWITNIPDNQFTFFLSLFITTMFMAFTALLIRKLGAVTLFYLFAALISIPINNLGGLGFYKVPILFIAAIIFELFFLLLKKEIKNIPLDVVLGAAFSNFSIPFTMLLFIPATKELMSFVWNFALIAFILGIMASIMAFLAWYNIKNLKPIIKFEYST
tara:strand:- start:8782 stop:9339 length:558 start_codon:yes stop_codon:yes gene_type:complete